MKQRRISLRTRAEFGLLHGRLSRLYTKPIVERKLLKIMERDGCNRAAALTTISKELAK